MNPKSGTRREWMARSLTIITLLAGIFGFGLQFLPDMESMALFLGVGVIGGLAGSSKSFDERDNQLLWQSYSTAFQWQFIVMYAVYGLVEVLRWLQMGEAVIGFMSLHWLGLTVSTMCILLGLAGLQNFREEEA